MRPKDLILFLLMLTFSFSTSDNGVSYSFIILTVVWLIPKIKIIVKQKEMISAIALLCFYMFFFLDEKILTILNFALVSFFMLSLSKVDIKKPIFFLKSYINLSLIILIIQIVFENLFGIYFNQIWESPEALGLYWRPNGISFEPSYASCLVVLSGFCLGKNLSKFYLFNIIIQVLIFSSSFGFVALLLLLISRFLKSKFISLTPILIALPFVFYSTEMYERFQSVLSSFSISDISYLVEADHSAAIRITPFIILFEYEWLQLQSLFPKTMLEYKTFIVDYLPGVDIDFWAGGGFLPSSIFTFGAFAIIFYAYVYKNYIYNFFAGTIFFVCAINIPFSTQAFATILILLKIGEIIFNSNKNFKYDINSLSR